MHYYKPKDNSLSQATIPCTVVHVSLVTVSVTFTPTVLTTCALTVLRKSLDIHRSFALAVLTLPLVFPPLLLLLLVPLDQLGLRDPFIALPPLAFDPLLLLDSPLLFDEFPCITAIITSVLQLQKKNKRIPIQETPMERLTPLDGPTSLDPPPKEDMTFNLHHSFNVDMGVMLQLSGPLSFPLHMMSLSLTHSAPAYYLVMTQHAVVL
jgi:hypothetical protein